MSLRSRYKETIREAARCAPWFHVVLRKSRRPKALKKFPVVNASVEGTDVIYHNYYDIGIAVSTERGLMVPVIRDVDQMSFADFERELGDVAK